MSPQEKPCIFVTAPGRAGTGFLARVLSRLVEGCHSVHEPDVLYFYRLLRIVRAEAYLLEKIRDFGVFQMTIGKLLTSGNLRSLGIALAKSSFPEDKAVDAIRAMRVHYISRIELPIYAESNPQLEGVFHLLPIVFPNSKIVYLTRDGRQWVRSFLNRVPVMFWKKDLLSYLPNGRPGAHMFKDDPFYNRWYSFSQFQRLCWLWRFRLSGALRRMKRIENIKMVSYEALLEGEKRQEVFEDLLKFVCEFPDGTQVEYQWDENVFTREKVGESQYNNFPEWPSWSLDRVREFQEICGDLQSELGYGKEAQWIEMTKKANKLY